MRSRKLFATAALALPLLAGLTACGELQEAQEGAQQAKERLDQAQRGLDNATACAEALNLIRFAPSFGDLERARADSEANAQEIGRLAERTTDQNLREDLLEVQRSVEQVAAGEVTPENSLDWTQQHVDKTTQVATTCGNMVN